MAHSSTVSGLGIKGCVSDVRATFAIVSTSIFQFERVSRPARAPGASPSPLPAVLAAVRRPRLSPQKQTIMTATTLAPPLWHHRRPPVKSYRRRQLFRPLPLQNQVVKNHPVAKPSATEHEFRTSAHRHESTARPIPPSAFQPPSRKVHFDALVECRFIPSRYHYSHEVRSMLWPTRTELYETTRRNTKERCFEDRDWRLATEEAEFVVVDGELVHPVHAQGSGTPTGTNTKQPPKQHQQQ